MLSSLNQASGVHVLDPSLLLTDQLAQSQQRRPPPTSAASCTPIDRAHSNSPAATRKKEKWSPENEGLSKSKDLLKTSASSGAIRTMHDESSDDDDHNDFRARPAAKADTTAKSCKSASLAKSTDDSSAAQNGATAKPERAATANAASKSSMAQKLKLANNFSLQHGPMDRDDFPSLTAQPSSSSSINQEEDFPSLGAFANDEPAPINLTSSWGGKAHSRAKKKTVAPLTPAPVVQKPMSSSGESNLFSGKLSSSRPGGSDLVSNGFASLSMIGDSLLRGNAKVTGSATEALRKYAPSASSSAPAQSNVHVISSKPDSDPSQLTPQWSQIMTSAKKHKQSKTDSLSDMTSLRHCELDFPSLGGDAVKKPTPSFKTSQKQEAKSTPAASWGPKSKPEINHNDAEKSSKSGGMLKLKTKQGKKEYNQTTDTSDSANSSDKKSRQNPTLAESAKESFPDITEKETSVKKSKRSKTTEVKSQSKDESTTREEGSFGSANCESSNPAECEKEFCETKAKSKKGKNTKSKADISKFVDDSSKRLDKKPSKNVKQEDLVAMYLNLLGSKGELQDSAGDATVVAALTQTKSPVKKAKKKKKKTQRAPSSLSSSGQTPETLRDVTSSLRPEAEKSTKAESIFPPGLAKLSQTVNTVLAENSKLAASTKAPAPPPGFNTKPTRGPPPGFTRPSSSNSTPDTTKPLFPVSDQPEYIKVAHFSQRNHDLFTNISRKLAQNSDISNSLSRFKSLSVDFRSNAVDANFYYKQCLSLFGDQKSLNDVMPELISLLPDISKQNQLLDVHRKMFPLTPAVAAQEEDALQDIVDSASPSPRPMSVDELFCNCPNCNQVLITSDLLEHVLSHQANTDFPALAAATTASVVGVGSWES